MSDGWKDTLNLPRTDFPMRGNLPKREPEFLAHWSEVGPYGRWQQRSDAPKFVLHDGPPYANGEIHIGHALNKLLKDFVVKYFGLRGYRVPYVPGWDCHGLPIETQVSKQLGDEVAAISDPDFRKACREYADKYVGIQREAFQRLGVFGDWDNPYRTMDYAYEAETLRRLADLVEGGYVFRRRKPVAWSIANQTALAEAELEYRDREDVSIYVLFPIADTGELPGSLNAEAADPPPALMIWTTTPWTLPANLAVAVAPDADYGLYVVETDRGRRQVIVAEALTDGIFDKAGVRSAEQLGSCRGSALAAGAAYNHPFVERTGQVHGADFVTLEDGTGIVHIAPGHGADDYQVGLKHGLEPYCPVQDDGTFDDSAPSWLVGEIVWKGNDLVVERLGDSGDLFHAERFTHSYPHDWRSKTPIVFRATDQWFIGMERAELRHRAQAAIAETEWTPAWAENRIMGMVENRPDWCISRQRRWGVPIAVPFCDDCDEPALDPAIIRGVAKRFEDGGADVWFAEDVGTFLPAGYRCTACGSNAFRKETDILDVWFDSGISWAAVCAVRDELGVPVDLYLEGSDQHRGWFQASLLLGTALTDHAPFKGVLTHGFVVDGQGRKMSKSAGNVMRPQDIVEKYGAELLRLWVASEMYDDDTRISDEILKRVIDAYRRIRNTFRFMLGNLSDFDPHNDAVPIEGLEPLDAYMMYRFKELRAELIAAYDAYQYHLIYQKVVRFCAVDLSALFLDVTKDRLYTEAAASRRRRSAQTVLHHVAEQLAILVAPVLSFTAEEVWQHLPGRRQPSVFLAKILDPLPFELGTAARTNWDELIGVRDRVLAALEAARNDKQIGNALEAKILIAARGLLRDVLEAKADFLAEWFIVSQVELVDWDDDRLPRGDDEDDPVRVAVVEPEGDKCDRCWQYRPEVGHVRGHDDLCQRCADVVADLGVA